MDLYSLYSYLFEEIGDDRVKDWLFMKDPFLLILIAILYLLLVIKWGPQFMEKRKPYKLTNIIRCYNIFQIISCTAIFIGIGSNGWLTGELSLGCHPVDYSDNPTALRLAAYVWWTLLLKIVEFIETIFFVLRKKYNQVSNLHLYHHTSTMLAAWVGVKYVAGGMTTFPIMLNCIVHIIMYGYYFLSTLGPQWQKKLNKFKNKITVIQMTQFTILLMHIMQILVTDCNFSRVAAALFVPNVIIVFYMFYGFYKQAYNQKAKSK